MGKRKYLFEVLFGTLLWPVGYFIFDGIEFLDGFSYILVLSVAVIIIIFCIFLLIHGTRNWQKGIRLMEEMNKADGQNVTKSIFTSTFLLVLIILFISFLSFFTRDLGDSIFDILVIISTTENEKEACLYNEMEWYKERDWYIESSLSSMDGEELKLYAIDYVESYDDLFSHNDNLTMEERSKYKFFKNSLDDCSIKYNE